MDSAQPQTRLREAAVLIDRKQDRPTRQAPADGDDGQGDGRRRGFPAPLARRPLTTALEGK